MPKPWTKERLSKLTHKQLATLYEHARDTASAEADDIIEMIFQHKLLDSMGGGLPRHHRTIQQIESICRSSEGNRAAVAAAQRGEAPIAGVDPILKVRVRATSTPPAGLAPSLRRKWRHSAGYVTVEKLYPKDVWRKPPLFS